MASFYRDTYLRSPHWKLTRQKKLSASNFECSLCERSFISPDVHHLTYKRIGGENIGGDLKCLCRECHNNVHALLKKYPKLKKLPPLDQWRIVMSHLCTNDARRERWKNFGLPESTTENITTKEFQIIRNVLVSMRLVKRERMKFSLALEPLLLSKPNPLTFLREYIKITGSDPRYRPDRIGAQRLLPC